MSEPANQLSTLDYILCNENLTESEALDQWLAYQAHFASQVTPNFKKTSEEESEKEQTNE